MRKLDIGSIGLAERSGEYLPIMGPDRAAALALIYRQANCRYVPVDTRMGKGYRELTWSDIAWENDYYQWDRNDGKWARDSNGNTVGFAHVEGD